MSCLNSALTGLLYDQCKPNLGGIEAVYIAPFDDVSAVTVDTGNTVEATAIAMESGKTYIGYHFREETGSLTSTLNLSDNGGRYYTNEANLVFDRMEKRKHLEIQVLTSEDCSVIVKDNNGEYWLLSKDKPARATANVAETNAGFDDHNGYNLTIAVRSDRMPIRVTDVSNLDAILDEPAS